MCTTSDLYRICTCIFNSCRKYAQDLHSDFLTCVGFHAYMFNSCRICARNLCYMGTVPAYSIPRGYVHHSDLCKICACVFNSHRICAQNLHSDFLDYFSMKDLLGMLEDSLESMIQLKCALGDDSDSIRSLDGIWLTEEELAYWGLSDSVLFIGGLPSTKGMIIFFFLINH